MLTAGDRGHNVVNRIPAWHRLHAPIDVMPNHNSFQIPVPLVAHAPVRPERRPHLRIRFCIILVSNRLSKPSVHSCQIRIVTDEGNAVLVFNDTTNPKFILGIFRHVPNLGTIGLVNELCHSCLLLLR